MTFTVLSKFVFKMGVLLFMLVVWENILNIRRYHITEIKLMNDGTNQLQRLRILLDRINEIQ